MNIYRKKNIYASVTSTKQLTELRDVCWDRSWALVFVACFRPLSAVVFGKEVFNNLMQ